jgi:hypothetical protein
MTLMIFILLPNDSDGKGQAGGACRDSDGGILKDGLFHGIEIKGSCRKGSTWSTFTFKDIRIQNTHWKHLFLLGRVREPASWRSVSDVESYVWLGYVSLFLSFSLYRSLSLSRMHTHTHQKTK